MLPPYPIALQCDVDQFAPFAQMDVCGECQDGYAPVQGSSRCFAGFSGRVLVTEGLSTDSSTVYDPNGVIIKIYGDVAADVTANAVLGGATFTTDQAPGVAAFGGALDGECRAWPFLPGACSMCLWGQCGRQAVLRCCCDLDVLCSCEMNDADALLPHPLRPCRLVRHQLGRRDHRRHLVRGLHRHVRCRRRQLQRCGVCV